ncbi:MAG: SDR family NAD(P)-dependent oxidoreductase [Thaumarchaeota archaeon]|nr:SDR family NAD(P)-dependent oxidoreductase [Nitrososphaerota archaeon]MBI3641316.1 SDR family NAD(P)-dependent oxidoreductase [Nitrososphaerota archaeon]
MFEGKKILITGGTGSLGYALTKRLLESDADTVRIFSRNENKQVNMQAELHDKRLRFLVGDVRDLPRLNRAIEDIDIVFHAAAIKHVPIVEYNPFEAIKTNVLGSQNVIDACLHENVEIAVCIGTDKAVSPLNTYGATKLLMEKLFVTASNYLNPKRHKTKFVAVRYGNVLGSSGSVVPIFVNQIKTGKKITVTDPTMTRFNITMNQALDLIIRAVRKGQSGDVFVPKLDAYKLGDLKNAITELLHSKKETEIISVRPGEKYHEVLINNDEIRNTFEDKEDYVIIREGIPRETLKNRNIKKAILKNQYSSDNVKLLTKNKLKEILIKEKLVSIK